MKTKLRRLPVRHIAKKRSRGVDVTRSEFNRVIDVVNQRGLENRTFIDQITRNLDVQFQRIAQLQLELDRIKKAWTTAKLAPLT